jgi:hypothetical protein
MSHLVQLLSFRFVDAHCAFTPWSKLKPFRPSIIKVAWVPEHWIKTTLQYALRYIEHSHRGIRHVLNGTFGAFAT